MHASSLRTYTGNLVVTGFNGLQKQIYKNSNINGVGNSRFFEPGMHLNPKSTDTRPPYSAVYDANIKYVSSVFFLAAAFGVLN